MLLLELASLTLDNYEPKSQASEARKAEGFQKLGATFEVPLMIQLLTPKLEIARIWVCE